MRQKYGKLIDGVLKLHGPDFPIVNKGGGVTVTNDPKLLTAHGFKPVIESAAEPPEGYVPTGYVPTGYVWEETDVDIRPRWEYAPAEIDSAPTVEERLETVELLLLEMLGVEI
jgi:hypothetical protein